MNQNVIECNITFLPVSGIEITPLVAIDGGIQGENNATAIDFKIKNFYFESDVFSYRIEAVDALGITHTSNVVTRTPSLDGSYYIYYALSRSITSVGGLVEINLVLTADGQTRKTPTLKLLLRPTKTDDNELLKEVNSAMVQLMALCEQTEVLRQNAERCTKEAETHRSVAEVCRSDCLHITSQIEDKLEAVEESKGMALGARVAAEGFAQSAADSMRAVESAMNEAEESAQSAADFANFTRNTFSSASYCADQAGVFAEQAKDYMEQTRDIKSELGFILYDDNPQWEDFTVLEYGGQIPCNVSLSSKKKYIAKVEAEFVADAGFVSLGFEPTGPSTANYVDGCYLIEFNGIDFSGDARFCWASSDGSIVGTKVMVYAVDSVANVVGNIDSALDKIIAIQENLIGGES